MLKQKWPPWMVWALLSVAFAIASTVPLFNSNVWYDIFRPRMWLVGCAAFPVPLFWIVATTLAFRRFPSPRRRLWLLLPVPVCLLPFEEALFIIWGFSRM
jgi:hypothetical protein